MAAAFRFIEADHSYWLGDRRVPSVTQLLDMGGLVNGGAYYTEESRRRGTAVHAMTADLDMGALDLANRDLPYRGYVLAYSAAVDALKPSWSSIEVADVHPGYGFAGRIDRLGDVCRRFSVVEVKTAAKAKHHAVQTALQAILTSTRARLAPEMIQRLTIYLKDTGRFSVESHEDRRDFDVAHDLIRRFCR